MISCDIEGVEEYESLILTKHQQQRRTLRFFNNYLRDFEGNITGCLSAAYDVTDFNEMQSRLQESKEYAVNANNAKSEYLSRISHEIRTPLNAIIGFTQLIKINKIDKQEHEYNDEIYFAGQHLLSLINDVLNRSHIESGKISLIIEDVHLASFMDECIAP